jgi:hypothetical protein
MPASRHTRRAAGYRAISPIRRRFSSSHPPISGNTHCTSTPTKPLQTTIFSRISFFFKKNRHNGFLTGITRNAAIPLPCSMRQPCITPVRPRSSDSMTISMASPHNAWPVFVLSYVPLIQTTMPHSSPDEVMIETCHAEPVRAESRFSNLQTQLVPRGSFLAHTREIGNKFDIIQT